MRKQKKAQVQLGENVVIMVIFFFLLIMAVVFYAGIQKSRIATKQYQINTVALLDSKAMITSMPELLCTENNDVTESCIDIINLDVMKKYWDNIKNTPSSAAREYYKYRFGASEITIKRFDAYKSVWASNWTLYNNSENMNYSRVVYVPVSLYNATSDDYSFGLLEYRRYSNIR
jgi:hypothetical protein